MVDGVELVLFPGTEPLPHYGVTDPDDIAWMAERLTPHPCACFEQALRLTDEAALGDPETHIVCTSTLATRDPGRTGTGPRRRPLWDIDTGHDLMITEPAAVADLLLRVAAPPSPFAAQLTGRQVPGQCSHRSPQTVKGEVASTCCSRRPRTVQVEKVDWSVRLLSRRLADATRLSNHGGAARSSSDTRPSRERSQHRPRITGRDVKAGGYLWEHLSAGRVREAMPATARDLEGDRGSSA